MTGHCKKDGGCKKAFCESAGNDNGHHHHHHAKPEGDAPKKCCSKPTQETPAKKCGNGGCC